MFSVVLVFSMLGLGRILISDLVANLLMYSLPGMIPLYTSLHFVGDRVPDVEESDSSGLSTGVVAVITFTVTFIVSVTATAIITFIVAYVCVKRTFEKANNNPNRANATREDII